MTEEQIIINKLKRVWDNCLNSELRNTIDTTITCIEKLQDENEDIQQSCENYYNEMRSYKNKVAELEKENGIQWHKVSEELPKAEIGIHNVETYRVLKLNAYKNPVECYCSYNNRTQKFENVVDTKESVYWKEIEGVVAWQEIPLVPEEVNAWLDSQIKE